MAKLNQIIAVEKSVKSAARHAKAIALGSVFAVELQIDRGQTNILEVLVRLQSAAPSCGGCLMAEREDFTMIGPLQTCWGAQLSGI